MSEVKRTAIIDKGGANKLASIVQSSADPTKYGLVLLNPDGSSIADTIAVWGSITGTLANQTDLQTALNGKQTTTLADGKILVGNGSNVATAVTPSGDATISNTGVVTIGANKVTYTKTYNGSQLAVVSAMRFLSGN